MRIPEINSYIGPTPTVSKKKESTGRRDVLNIAQGVTKVLQDVNKFKVEEADYALQGKMNAFERDNAGKEWFNTNEIPAGTVSDDVLYEQVYDEVTGTTKTQRRTQLHASEVYPELQKRAMDGYIDQASAGISNSIDRRRWLGQSKRVSDDMNTKTSIANEKRSRDYRAKKRLTDVDNALQNDDFSLARDMASTLEDPRIKADVGKKIAKNEEKSFYLDSMSEMNETAIRGGIEKLENKDYSKTGALNDTERLSMLNALRSDLNSLQAKDRAASKTFFKLQQDNARTMIKTMSSGDMIDPTALDQMIRVSNSEDFDPVIRRNLLVAKDSQLEVSALLDMPMNKRDATLSTYQQQVFEGSPTSVAMQERKRDWVLKANEQAAVEQRQDNFSWATNHFKMPVTPIRWDNPQAAMADLQARKATSEQVFNLTGQRSYLMSKGESEQFGELFEDSSEAEKLQIMGMVTTSLGEDAHVFFEPLSEHISAGLTFSANLAAEGDIGNAKALLRGAQLRKQETIKLKNFNSEYAPKITEAVGGAYSANSQMSAMHKDAVADAYAFLSDKAGDYTVDVVDNDRLQEAINMVSGGFVEQSGRQLLPPVKNWTQKNMDNWTSTLSPEYIDQSGGTLNYGSSEGLIEAINDGSLQMQGRKRGEYVLFNPEMNSYVTDKEGGTFLLRYDPSAPIKQTELRLGRKRSNR